MINSIFSNLTNYFAKNCGVKLAQEKNVWTLIDSFLRLRKNSTKTKEILPKIEG